MPSLNKSTVLYSCKSSVFQHRGPSVALFDSRAIGCPTCCMFLAKQRAGILLLHGCHVAHVQRCCAHERMLLQYVPDASAQLPTACPQHTAHEASVRRPVPQILLQSLASCSRLPTLLATPPICSDHQEEATTSMSCTAAALPEVTHIHTLSLKSLHLSHRAWF